MVNSESVYNGASYLLDPSYNFTGYKIPTGEMGATTGIQTANQLKEVSNLLNQGVKNTEVSIVQPEILEMVPKNQFKEIKRLNKLTGAESSLHAPVVEVSGIGKEGWDEINREVAEKQITDTVTRAHDLDPNGNVPVTIHASAQIPELEPKSKDKEGKEKTTGMFLVDPDSGKFGQIPKRKRYFTEEGEFTGEPQEMDPRKELNTMNNEAWTEQLSGVNRYANYGEEILEKAENEIDNLDKSSNITQEQKDKIISALASGNTEKMSGKEEKFFKKFQREINHGQLYLKDAYRNMKQLFDSTYNKVERKDKDKLDRFAKWAAPIVKKSGDKKIENNPDKLREFGEVIEKGLKALGNLKNPKPYVPANEFVINKSSETFANVANDAYAKFGSKAPIISIENPPGGQGLSRAEDMKKLIEESRKKFSQKLIKQGKSKAEAKKAAENLIGATWDTSHISMIRKQGYSEKDLIKESEKVAPFVKHVHYNDNFGNTHTDLPPGMGSVPMKEIMGKFKKAGFKGKKVFEGGNFVQHFKSSPMPYVLESSGSPLYTTGGPAWNQVGGMGSYYSGLGPINPPVHHQTYGTGFNNLPMELGGQIPGTQNRMSGTPNQ